MRSLQWRAICFAEKENGALGPVPHVPGSDHQTEIGSAATIALPGLQLKACAK